MVCSWIARQSIPGRMEWRGRSNATSRMAQRMIPARSALSAVPTSWFIRRVVLSARAAATPSAVDAVEELLL